MNNPRSMKAATGLTSEFGNLFCDTWFRHELSRKFTLAGAGKMKYIWWVEEVS